MGRIEWLQHQPRFNPWVRNIPWRWVWQPTPVFLPGKSHGWEEAGRPQSIGSQRIRHNCVTNTQLICNTIYLFNVCKSIIFSTLRVVQPLLLCSHPAMFDSLWPHGLQHSRPLCPSPSPEGCPSSCPLHQWWHQPSYLLMPSDFRAQEKEICHYFHISPSICHEGMGPGAIKKYFNNF